jgi:hypothetical protein
MAVTLDSYVTDTLMRDLVRHDRAPSAFLVYLWLWSKTRGAGRTSFGASLQTIATETGLSKSSVQNGLRRLRRRKLIAVRHSGPTAAGLFEVLEPWKRQR